MPSSGNLLLILPLNCLYGVFGIVDRFSIFAATGFNSVLGLYLFNGFGSNSIPEIKILPTCKNDGTLTRKTTSIIAR